jgi:DNA-binding PadR family transcriptional regulator
MNELEEIVKGNLELVILSLLKQSMHGYKLKEILRKRYHTPLSPSVVYPLLHKMEKNGWVKNHWDLNGSRPEKIYVLTVQGSQHLRLLEAEYRIFVSDFVWGDRLTIQVEK